MDDVINLYSLSNYAETLGDEDRCRYLRKLQILNIDCPYKIPDSVWKTGEDLDGILPPLSILLIPLFDHSTEFNYWRSVCKFQKLGCPAIHQERMDPTSGCRPPEERCCALQSKGPWPFYGHFESTTDPMDGPH
jgi:hypothetical protein